MYKTLTFMRSKSEVMAGTQFSSIDSKSKLKIKEKSLSFL